MTINEVLQKEYRKRIKADAMSIGNGYETWADLDGIFRQASIGDVESKELINILEFDITKRAREFNKDRYSALESINGGLMPDCIKKCFGTEKDMIEYLKENTERVIVINAVTKIDYAETDKFNRIVHRIYDKTHESMVTIAEQGIVFYMPFTAIINERYEIVNDACAIQMYTNILDDEINADTSVYCGEKILDSIIRGGGLLSSIIEMI